MPHTKTSESCSMPWTRASARASAYVRMRIVRGTLSRSIDVGQQILGVGPGRVLRVGHRLGHLRLDPLLEVVQLRGRRDSRGDQRPRAPLHGITTLPRVDLLPGAIAAVTVVERPDVLEPAIRRAFQKHGPVP